ncbi:MAG: hypothetical protein ACJ75Q_00550 [Gaiellaceae bacterium]
MSATIEKVVGARRSRLAIVDEALAADEEALERARARFVQLAADEEAAVRESKRKDPGASPYALRAPAQLLRDEREKLERTISGLERGIEALKSERVEAAAEQAARELRERAEEARDLTAREREARIAAAKAFKTFVERWNGLVDVLSRKSELVATVGREQLVAQVGIFDRDAVETWKQVAGFLVEPVPVDLEGFLDEAIEATTGERPGEGDEGIAELNRYRATQGLAPEVRHVTPAARELADTYPDLRGEIRTAAVSGAAIRRSASAEPPWPSEAA